MAVEASSCPGRRPRVCCSAKKSAGIRQGWANSIAADIVVRLMTRRVPG